MVEIIADDWGFSRGINDGILDLAQRGVLRGASLVANSPNLSYRLDELLDVPGVRIHLHLNLTAGAPLLGDRVYSLRRSREDQFYSFTKFWLNWAVGSILPFHLQAEATAQAQRILSCCGRIDELDSHHHVHLLPGVLPTIEQVIKSFGIRTVRLVEDWGHLWTRIGSRWVRYSFDAGKEFDFRSYGYPQKGAFFCRQKFLLSAREGARPVIAHPAQYDDWSGNPYGDNLCRERVIQYEFLKRWFQ